MKEIRKNCGRITNVHFTKFCKLGPWTVNRFYSIIGVTPHSLTDWSLLSSSSSLLQSTSASPFTPSHSSSSLSLSLSAPAQQTSQSGRISEKRELLWVKAENPTFPHNLSMLNSINPVPKLKVFDPQICISKTDAKFLDAVFENTFIIQDSKSQDASDLVHKFHTSQETRSRITGQMLKLCYVKKSGSHLLPQNASRSSQKAFSTCYSTSKCITS